MWGHMRGMGVVPSAALLRVRLTPWRLPHPPPLNCLYTSFALQAHGPGWPAHHTIT